MTQSIETDFCDVAETDDGRIRLEFNLTPDHVTLIKSTYSVEDINEDVMLRFVYDALENYAQSRD